MTKYDGTMAYAQNKRQQVMMMIIVMIVMMMMIMMMMIVNKLQQMISLRKRTFLHLTVSLARLK